MCGERESCVGAFMVNGTLFKKRVYGRRVGYKYAVNTSAASAAPDAGGGGTERA